ncbi:MAG: hypothetical protein NTZ21_07965 [Actinobacteria bacterium]|nr:hypothetical protein [Actinomycetota bacterium]
MTTLGGVASAENGGGGKYPPNPVIIVVQNPTVPYGDPFWAKGKGLCVGGKAFFALQSVEDPTKVFFTKEIPVNPDGTVTYTFTAKDLAGFVGPVTVFVKQRDICNLTASTIVTIVKTPVASPSVSVKPNPVELGDDFTATAKGLCQGTVIFAVQSTSDWKLRFFSEPVKVKSDGTASYTFDDDDLPGGAGTYTVYAKQPQCNIVTTTTITVVGDEDEDEGKNDEDENEQGSKTEGGAGSSTTTGGTTEVGSQAVVPAAAAGITPQVLSTGLTAPAAATPAQVASSGTTAQAASAGVPSGTLPVTGSESSQTLQIALAAFVAGLGMIAVASMRRRTANVRSDVRSR